ncbi:tRNA (5-methylaminomethyl-2-thiouridylate)-methyltransferase [Mycoplasma haemofelis str. Langford 1]|uniref:tRNA-uridine 2-sulfurtransferase n=2 Tax=Mycoplasma haemofelis TaxID=29501 RepID=F6FFK9_MYCHI|nr:tRNA 2-thiouridine(34) synthase MnmA [Mycoplasma haemofelis]AEG72404.1 tRNA (5-methylaminomethyl-2-thiouridylate)-methyltransferase [Mycoplasma haemofelis Ohio2]CBY92091.1 tRNA (5-methylaminomethyl-2-thiouridylate)-methyltransferase [Mycoplasma haemofelis str. Langford 1]
MDSMKKVVIALSGGVDSAISAFLLKQKNHDLHAVYMQNWDSQVNEENAEDSGCSSREDLKYVKEICNKLNIPLTVYNFVPEYWEYVFEPYLNLVQNNLLSNPDILCNSKIKFGVLLNRIIQDFGPDIKLATGHWARVINRDGRYMLAVCSNPNKDQTYFLSRLAPDQLKYILFPLQDIQSKEEIREIAKDLELSVWNRRDSTGICFIGKRKYSDFMENFIDHEEGDLVDIETGKILGTHKGSHLYALHQRSGLALKGYEERYYVCKKDPKKNVVYLCRESQIPLYLHTTSTFCSDIHWINEAPNVGEELFIKARHTPSFLKVKLRSLENGECHITHEKTHITSPGQYVVFYDLDRNICLGSGIYKDGK